MTIYNLQEETIIEVYRCPVCNNCYLKNTRSHISCGVKHLPGSCCHYQERQLTEEVVGEIFKELLDHVNIK